MLASKLKQAYTFKANLKSIFFRPNDNYAPIDGLRGLSFIWMFMFHCFLYAKYHFGYDMLLGVVDESPLLFDWLWNADKAVDTFFFLSGFLISGLLFREQDKSQNIQLVRFYGRRYLRLTPVYVFSIFIFWLMRGPHYENLWQNLLYINNFFAYENMAMVWTWTLAVEEQFYLVFPLTLILFYRANISIAIFCLAFFILSFVIRGYLVYTDPLIRGIDMSVLISNSEGLQHYSSEMYDNLYTRFGAFICGIFIAYSHHYHKSTVTRLLNNTKLTAFLNLIFLSSFVAIVWMPVMSTDIHFSQGFKDFFIIANRNIYSLCLGWIILLCIHKHNSLRWLNRFLSLKLWYPFAQLSYSMYIFHIIFISGLMFKVRWLVDHQYIQADQVSFYFLLGFSMFALLMTFTFSIFTYIGIEKPFMNMRGNRGVKRASQ